MPKVIIADTSCFIMLANIGEFELLRKVYGQITTTIDIAVEFGQPFPDWVVIEKVSDAYRQQLLEMQIDKGESSAIALALETPDCTVILDDYKARKVAERLGIDFTGTLGIIIKAKSLGVILSVKPLLNKVMETTFRLSDEVIQQVLLAANER